MFKSKDELNEQFNILRNSYAKQLPDKIEQVEQSKKELVTDKDNAFKKLYQLVHSLSGSSAMFGLSLISEKAHEFELYLKSIKDNENLTNENLTQIDNYTDKLRFAIESVTKETEKQTGRIESEKKQIFVLDNDKKFNRKLTTQLDLFNYNVCVFDNVDDLEKSIILNSPNFIIVNTVYLQLNQNLTDIILREKSKQKSSLLVIFISDQDDFEARLHSVRANGDAYFTKPVDIIELVDKLNLLNINNQPEQFKILVVDDEPAIAENYILELQNAGMITKIIADPTFILPALENFHPDLILIDFNLLDCNGMELSRIIKQQEDFLNVPIIFLFDNDYSRIPRNLDCDGFLTKPVKSENLVSLITAKLQNLNISRSIANNNFSKVLNYQIFKERFNDEVARAKRLNTEISFALLEIDNFKQILDKFGYNFAKNITKSLLRLIQLRLRRTDIIGQDADNRFLLLFPNSKSTDTEKVINEIQNIFTRIIHSFEDLEHTYTFSCSIVDISLAEDPKELFDSTYKVLYKIRQKLDNEIIIVKK